MSPNSLDKIDVINPGPSGGWVSLVAFALLSAPCSSQILVGEHPAGAVARSDPEEEKPCCWTILFMGSLLKKWGG